MSGELYHLHEGNSPLVVSCPHAGTHVPEPILMRMTEAGRSLADTDWHVDRLYDFVPELGATFLVANVSRYAADLNRDPDGAALYPGRFETDVCPVRTFSGQAIYKEGQEPSPAEKAERLGRYWRPYHTRLSLLIGAAKAKHGFVLLLDAHSILSHLPLLFDGQLPDLNLGTVDGKSCNANIEHAAVTTLSGQSEFSFAANGRFKGGYITRHYGNPRERIHAMQLEIGFRAYLDENNPAIFDRKRAEPLRRLLHAFVSALIDHQALARP